MKPSSFISTISRSFNDLSLIFHLSKQRYVENHHIDRAAALTFYTLFSMVPLGTLILALVKGFGLGDSFNDIVEKSYRLQELFKRIFSYAERTLDEVSGGLLASIGLLMLFFTTMFLVIHIERAFNTIWGLHRKRNLWHKLSDYAALLLLTPLVVMMISKIDGKINDILPVLNNHENIFHTIFYFVISMFMEMVAPGLCCLLFSMIYRFAPNSREVSLRSALISGFIAGTGFILLKNGIFALQDRVFNYNNVYGDFAILPLTLLWLHWSWALILFCGEIGFVCQNTKSGIFVGRELRKLTPKQRCEYQLLIAREIYRSFSGSGENRPISEQELFARIPLSETVLRRELYELTRCGIIYRSNENEKNNLLLPGAAPEKFTISDFFKRIYGSGEEIIKEFAKCEKYFSDIEENFAASDKNILIRDLDIADNKGETAK